MKNNSSGQVAVEFILMFIFVGALLLFLFRFSVTTTALEYREYAAFMVGRAITASAANYNEKAIYAGLVAEQYNDSQGRRVTEASGNLLECSENISQGKSSAFQYVLQYGTGISPATVSSRGIACSTNIDEILPLNSGQFRVVIEVMTGSEIADSHCVCEMDFMQDWASCINSTTNPTGSNVGILDNGC